MKNKQQNNLKKSNKKTIKKTLTMSGIAVMAATAGMVSADDAKADELKNDDQQQSQTTTLNNDNESTTVTLKPQSTYLTPEMLAESKTVITDEGAAEPTVEQKDTDSDNSNMNITPIKTASKGDVTPTDANWKFNGTFNATVATVDYHKSGSTKPAGTLDVSGISRVPNENFGDAKYFAITVKRGDSVLYDNQRVGNERGTKFAESLNLQPGDIIELYHAEPGRLVVSDDASMKQTTVVNKQKDYVYQVAQDLSLANISDYAYLDRKVRGFFTNDKKDALAFGVQQPNLDDLKKLLDDSKTKLTDEQRQIIQNNLNKAQELLDKAPGALPLNQVQTKDFYVLPKSVSIDTTQKETRYLGTNQDRQDLGLVLQNGGKIRVRQTNPDYKGNVQVQMIGDSTQKMSTTNVGSDWVEITANGDQVPFLYTAKSDDPTQPRLEYEVVAGTAKQLPIFDSTSDQTKVLDQWNNSRVPFALIETNNIQLLVPSNDMQRIKDMDVKALINQYDNELFSLYDDLSGLPKNTDKDHPVKGRYFAFADNTGEASGVWYPNRITQNGRSISGYLNIGWLALHEIAHGYEVTSDTMKTFESFNNIYGAIYQTKHLDNFVKNSWLFSGGKEPTVNKAVTSVLDENKTWKDLDLKTRLMYWLDLAKNLRDEEAFTKFNTLHQEIAKNGGDIGDLGRAWTETYADNYQLNVASFFDTLGVPMDEATEMNNYNKLPAVAILAQVVPEDKIADVMKQLGWNDQDTPLQSKASLVTNEDLKKTGLKSHITLNITNPDEIKGTTLSIMDGDKVVKTVPVNGATVDLGELPNGVYTFKSSDPSVSFEDKYLYVKEDKTVDETVKKDADILEAVKSLFTDDTYTKLKDTVTLDQINEAQKGVDVIENSELKAKNQALVDKAKSLINEFVPKGYDGPFVSYRYLNNDGVLRINTFHREPNYRRGGVKHTTVTVTDKNGNVKYTKTYLGSDMLDVGEDTIQLAPGDKINFKTPFDGMQTVYPDELQDGSNLKDITYEVTPDLKLRLPNEAPVIEVEQEQFVFQDDEYDPISPEWVYKVHDREDGDIELTYENVVTNVNPEVPGIYHTKYTVVDSEGKRTSVIVNVRVESFDGEEGEDHPLTPEELAQGEPEVPVKEETPAEETKPADQPAQEAPAEETKPEEQPSQETPAEETKPEEQSAKKHQLKKQSQRNNQVKKL
ncbi:toxin Cry1Ac domain D-VI-related protein, partial [Ligilactobacillus hayakitensis]|uniref:toxin Cry1Ac domain D-VI-related protein n=1 Tax=Ligilactobacillus hayakitensis TaxID=396716 RepID=UPI000469B74E